MNTEEIIEKLKNLGIALEPLMGNRSLQRVEVRSTLIISKSLREFLEKNHNYLQTANPMSDMDVIVWGIPPEDALKILAQFLAWHTKIVN